MKTLKPTQLALSLLVAGVTAAPVFQARALTWTSAAGDLLWSNPLNWDFNTAPVSTDALLFDNFTGFTNGPGLVNNVMDVSNSVNTISYTARADLGNYHTTQIPAGQTLSVEGTSGTLFNVGTGADDGGGAQVNVVMSGGGNLVVGSLASPAGTFQVVQASATSGAHTANLDLSGLNSFTAGVSLLLVGDGVTIARRAGILTLAKTNVIRATSSATTGAIRVGNISTGNGGGISEMILGQENIISADFLRIAGRRASVGNVRFQPGLINPTLKLRGADTTGRMGTLTLGDNRENSTSTSVVGTLDATGATVDILVATMILGYEAPANPPGGTGIVKLEAGTLDVITLNLGSQQVDSPGSASGTLNVNGAASAIIGTLNIGGDRGTNTGAGTGVLNIGGGTVTVTGNVVENNAPGGNGVSTINQTSGTMRVNGTTTVDNLNLTGGAFYAARTVTVNNLNLQNNTLLLTLDSEINATNPVCHVTNLNITAPATLSVQGGGFALGQYPLIKYYSGSIGGDGYPGITLGSLPSRTEGYLSNNITEASIDLVVTSVSAAKWNGNVSGGNWDINTTTNWTDLLTSAATTYLEASVPGDTVIFDDSASGTTTVNLTTVLSPVLMTIDNSTKTYVFNGPGALSGPVTLTKSGSGTSVLTNSGMNDFSGGVAINGGTLRLGLAADRLPTNASVTLADVAGAVLELGDQDQTLRILSGGGPGGGDVNLGSGNLTTTASGTYLGAISGTGMFRKVASGTQTLGGASTYSGGTLINGGALTLINTNGSGVGTGPVEIAAGTLNVGNGASAGLDAGTLITNNGALVFNATNDTTLTSIHGTGAVTKNNTNTVTITSGGDYTGATTINNGALRISDATGLGDTTGGTHIETAAAARLELQGDITVLENFTLDQKAGASGQVPHIVNLSGTNTLSGSMQGNAGGSYWSFRSDAGKLIVNGTFTHTPTGTRRLRLFGAGDGEWATDYPAGNATSAHVTMEGPGTWTLSAYNTYNANTELYGGTLIVNGYITAASGTVIVGDPATSTPATLSGSGFISCPVSVNANGTLAPGNSIGTLSVFSTLTTLGTCLFDLNTDTLEHDLVTGLVSVDYGGTLALNFTGSGTALTNGASFQLFSAGAYSSAFEAIVPAVPASGLSWDTSQLPVDGTLGIKTGPSTTPTSLTFLPSGNQLNISWPLDHTGWRLQVQTNTIDVGLSTNWFTVSGSTDTNQVFIPADPANGAVFYRLVHP